MTALPQLGDTARAPRRGHGTPDTGTQLGMDTRHRHPAWGQQGHHSTCPGDRIVTPVPVSTLGTDMLALIHTLGTGVSPQHCLGDRIVMLVPALGTALSPQSQCPLW